MIYHIFAGEAYYSGGAIADFIEASSDIHEALALALDVYHNSDATVDYAMICDFATRRAVLIGETPHKHNDEGWQVWQIGADFERGGLTGLLNIEDFRKAIHTIAGSLAEEFSQFNAFLAALRRHGKAK